MEFILIFATILGILWLARETYNYKITQEYNKKLFIRAHKHELFMMEIHKECPPETQTKIEQYLNNVPAL